MIDDQVAEARQILEEAGFVVLRAKSYRQAQERQRVADALREAADDHAKGMAAWARDCLDEQRRLASRLTFVYGVARAHGASVEELSAEPGRCGNLGGIELPDSSQPVCELLYGHPGWHRQGFTTWGELGVERVPE